jgi:diphthine synthase
MLFLIGLGLGSKDLSVRAMEEIRKPGLVFLETYTAFITKDYLRFLKREASGEIVQIERQDLEDRVNEMVARSKNRRVEILVPGDPLIATTHSIILNEAKKQGVKYEVIHSTSVFSVAIGESGLDVYKFGPTVTVPFWFENYKPTSFLKALERNVKNEEHTLLLLDIDQKNRKPMRIADAVGIIKKAEAAEKTGKIGAATKMIVLGDLGMKTQKILYLRLDQIGKEAEKKLEGKVLSLIVPARLTFAEEESLQRITS